MRWASNMPESVARREDRRGTRRGIRAAASAAARAAVYTIVVMAYDQELAGRIRQLIGSDPELTEKKMFGGLAFLIRSDDLRSDDQLARWIEIGTGYARSLLPKQKPVAARPYRRLP
jgi:hypothetical protein